MLRKLFLSLIFLLITISPAQAVSWPPEVKPEQGRAGWKSPVRSPDDDRVLGEIYTEISFWNVGAVSGDPTHAKALFTTNCAIPGYSGCGLVVEGTFTGGPNGVVVFKGFEYTLHDGQYFETVSGGKTYKFTVENPEIFSKYNWNASSEETSKLEDSGVAFSDVFGQVEVSIPRPDGTFDEESWDIARLDGKTLPVGTHIKTSEKSGGIISFADMTTFTLKPETEIVLSSPSSKDSAIKILWGNLMINVKKMMKDGSMEVEMSQAVAGIKGTQFIINETKTESTIKVTGGTVKFTSKSTGASVDVVAGESVTASSKGLSEKTAFDPDEEEKNWQELEDSIKKTNTNTLGNKNIIYFVGGIVIVVAIIIGFLILKTRKAKRV